MNLSVGVPVECLEVARIPNSMCPKLLVGSCKNMSNPPYKVKPETQTFQAVTAPASSNVCKREY